MKFSIGTFNVENLISAGKPIYDHQGPWYTPEQYHAKVAWVKQQITLMRADIIGFQEVFDEQSLRDCIAGTIYQDWYLFFAKREPDKPGNALLSRFPIISAQSIEDIPFAFDFFDNRKTNTDVITPVEIPITQFCRALVRAEIQISQTLNMVVYVVHLKSKHPIFPHAMHYDTASYVELAKGSVRSLIRRGIESAGIRQLLSQDIDHNSRRPIILLGDLNDSGNVVTNQIIRGEPPFLKLSEQQKAERWKYVLQDSVDVLARKSLENFHFTYIHNGRHESLDNIFVSNHFSPLNKHALGRILDLRALNDHVVDQTLSLNKKTSYVSDHGQVILSVRIFEPYNSR